MQICQERLVLFAWRNMWWRKTELSRISGSPLCKCRPARKSAHISPPRNLSVFSIRTAVSTVCSMTGLWLL